jgi:hypothetical protein
MFTPPGIQPPAGSSDCNCQPYDPSWLNMYLQMRKMYKFKIADQVYSFSDVEQYHEIFVTSFFMSTTLYTDYLPEIQANSYNPFWMNNRRQGEWFNKYLKPIIYYFNSIFLLRYPNTRIRFIFDWCSYNNLDYLDLPANRINNQTLLHWTFSSIVVQPYASSEFIHCDSNEQITFNARYISLITRFVDICNANPLLHAKQQFMCLLYLATTGDDEVCILEFFLYHFPTLTLPPGPLRTLWRYRDGAEYIGQSVRYLTLNQKSYNDGRIINPPNFIYIFDAHACGYTNIARDFINQWKSTGKTILVATQYRGYQRIWHELFNNAGLELQVRKGILAGIFFGRRDNAAHIGNLKIVWQNAYRGLFCVKQGIGEMILSICPQGRYVGTCMPNDPRSQYCYGNDEFFGTFLLADKNNRIALSDYSEEYINKIQEFTYYHLIDWFDVGRFFQNNTTADLLALFNSDITILSDDYSELLLVPSSTDGRNQGAPPPIPLVGLAIVQPTYITPRENEFFNRLDAFTCIMYILNCEKMNLNAHQMSNLELRDVFQDMYLTKKILFKDRVEEAERTYFNSNNRAYFPTFFLRFIFTLCMPNPFSNFYTCFCNSGFSATLFTTKLDNLLPLPNYTIDFCRSTFYNIVQSAINPNAPDHFDKANFLWNYIKYQNCKTLNHWSPRNWYETLVSNFNESIKIIFKNNIRQLSPNRDDDVWAGMNENDIYQAIVA